MNYFIVNEKGKALSSFYPNDLSGRSQLSFRNDNAMIFDTIEGAESHINYIQSSASGRTKSQALRLRVSTHPYNWTN